MTSKLTLVLDSNVIKHAKVYSKENETSISKMVENYLKSLSEKGRPNHSSLKTPSVSKGLRGMIPVKGGPVDYKQVIAEEKIRRSRR